MVSLLVSACGFQPIHKIHPHSNILASLQIPDTALGRALDQSLRQRLKLGGGIWRARVSIDETREETQINPQGIAQRWRMHHIVTLHLTHTPTNKTRTIKFNEQQSMTRGSSGADDITRQRALGELAMQRITEKILASLATLPENPTP